ncbi:MAG TPA: hypothetical protein VKB77_02815 [Terriglobales bacterium]|nr:hypothetical protein [Terriglobales bacterium]
MNCNVCDQLAAEMGELLLKQKQLSDAREPVAARGDLEKVTSELQTARQKLIDHLRLIHGGA